MTIHNEILAVLVAALLGATGALLMLVHRIDVRLGRLEAVVETWLEMQTNKHQTHSHKTYEEETD